MPTPFLEAKGVTKSDTLSRPEMEQVHPETRRTSHKHSTDGQTERIPSQETRGTKYSSPITATSVEYLLGLSNSRKREYHDISEQLGLCDGAIDELLQCKENFGNEEELKMYALQDTVILNDFLTSMEFETVMEKIKQSLFAYCMYELHRDSIAEKIQAEHAEQLKEAKK